MEGQKCFAVVGGDARQAAAARALARAGYSVGGPEMIAVADYILLPLPLDAARTPLAELLRAARPGTLALGVRLAALGAQVTAAARRPAQRALAESFGLRSVPIDRLGQIAPAFDTVVNTVPAPVLSEAVLARLRPQSFIVDLASRPGGTDFDAARRLGHRAIHALSLPAACAPETAGEAVAQTVCDMIGQREEAS